MSHFLQPPIILLKEGTDDSQGIPQLVSNINACSAVAETIRTTLGPRGMDKLIVDSNGKTTISNDAATIVALLNVVHPAAKTMVDIAQSQDKEAGDGTTTVVLLAAAFLKAAKPFVEDGVHPQIIIRSFRKALALARKQLNVLAINIADADAAAKRDMLIKCASTAMNSKLIHHHSALMSQIVVDAVSCLDGNLDLELIGIKKVTGGSLDDTCLVEGVAFKKTFSYAGFEQQPKSFKNPLIILLNVELELKAEKDNAEVRVKDPAEFQRIVDAEWTIIFEKLDKIVKSGAKVVLSRLPIGDLATQYFADRDIFCAGRVPSEDMARTAKATGAVIQTSINDLIPSVMGTCEVFDESQVGGERYNFFRGCKEAKTATIIIRGGAEQFIEEAHRSLHDAIMIVRRAIKTMSIVAGGGAIEMELSRFLHDKALEMSGKEQLLITAYARALEIIPRQLAANAGFDATDILTKLRQEHNREGGRWFGVDINNETIADNYNAFVWEPTLVKLNAITAATEAANVILSVDETIKNPGSQVGGSGGGGGGRGGGRGGRGGRRPR